MDGGFVGCVRLPVVDWVVAPLPFDSLVDCWFLVDRIPREELVPSILWFSLKLCLFIVGALVFWKRPTAASALKMCYAAWTKGTSALLLSIRALARAESVEEALVDEWARSQPDVLRRSEAATRVAGRAWRWVAEMEEIGRSFEDVALPAGAARAAAELYSRLAAYKDVEAVPPLDEIAAALLEPPA